MPVVFSVFHQTPGRTFSLGRVVSLSTGECLGVQEDSGELEWSGVDLLWRGQEWLLVPRLCPLFPG